VSEATTPGSTADQERKLWWEGPFHVAIHIVVGTGIFGVVALAAIGLAFLTAWAKTLTYEGEHVAGSLLVWGLMVGEYTLFAVDLLLFLVFLAKTSMRMSREL
jgi:hypothetical protein